MLRSVLFVAAVAGANAFAPSTFGLRAHFAHAPASCSPRRPAGVVSLRAEADGISEAAPKSELEKLRERAAKAMQEAEAAEKRWVPPSRWDFVSVGQLH